MAKKIRIGNVYEIPLPNGKKAYARLYKEYTLAIYEGLYDNYSQLEHDTKIYRFICVYRDVLNNPEWKIVDYKPFSNEDDAWAPPRRVIDPLTLEGRLYYKGVISKCTFDECKDLEVAEVWDKHHVEDMLMGSKKWDDDIGKLIKQEK